MTRPKGIHTKALTQKDHDRINILYRDALRTRKEIEAITGFTESQIKRALSTKFVSRGTGRPPKLTKAQEDELIAYVTANKEQQSMSYLELSQELFGHSFGEYAIRSTLRRRGFCRYNGKTKPEPAGKGGQQQQRTARSSGNVTSSSLNNFSGPREEGLNQKLRDGLEDIEQITVVDSGHSESRQMGSRKTQLSVLIGSGIIQLPIWGFAMSYGVFQQYYFDNWTLEGDRNSTGFIGTTANGVVYLSMPFLFALFTRRWAHRRQLAALCGTVIACVSFFLSSYSTTIGHLVATQGITSALGCALIYSPMTLSLGEWYSTSNRALAYGIVLSCKNIVGTGCPFMLRALIDTYGFRTTLMVWTAIVGGTSVVAICLIPTHPSKLAAVHETTRARRIPWSFLRHRSIYFYSVAIIFQSSGYGIPQTYLSTYARDIILLSQTSGTLMLALFNVPGIISSSFFGWLSDNKRVALSAQTVSAIPPITCAAATFLFWGLTTPGGLGLLVVFSVTFGFFSGGYSATWGGMLKQLERESAERNEAVDPGMLYGLLNGVRGIGYASGGFAGVGLLNVAETVTANPRFGYGTAYGPIILFTGITSLLGGWVVLWRWNPVRILPLVSRLASSMKQLHQ
ncbi:hypothetical protein PG989_010581 [Apiospora arundinis]